MSTAATSTVPRLGTPQFALLGSAALAYFLADGLLVPAVPRYVAGELTGGNIAVGLVVGAFSLSALVLRPWAGRLADRDGRSLAMVGGGIIFAVSVAAYDWVDSAGALAALRLLTGVGDAFFFVGALTAMSDLAPPERRGEAISLFSLSLYVGLAVGPPIGELLINHAGFTTLWLTAATSALLAVLLTTRVGDTRPATAGARGDNARTGTAESPGDDARSATDGSRGGDDRSGSGDGRVRLMPRAAVVPALLLLALVWGMAGFLAFVPLYALDLGLPGSGYLLFGFAGIVVLIRSVGARIPDRLGAVRSVRISLLCSTIGLALIGTWRSTPGLVLGTAVLGIGIALGTPAIMMLALDRAPAAERGAVMGTVSMSIDVAAGLAPATFGLIAAATTRPTAFLTAALIAATGLALATRDWTQHHTVSAPGDGRGSG